MSVARVWEIACLPFRPLPSITFKYNGYCHVNT